MLRICTRSAVVVLCLVTLATTVAAAARSLAFITIDFPGAILTNAQGINPEEKSSEGTRTLLGDSTASC